MLLPPLGPARWSVYEWLCWSIGGLAPMLGQLNFFAITDWLADVGERPAGRKGMRVLAA